MPAANIQTARDVFKSMDKDGNGTIDKEEYVQALRKLHIPKAMAELVTDSVFAKFDTNKDAGIDEKEFLKYFASDENIAIHNRIARSVFEEKFLLFFGIYLIVVGFVLTTNTKLATENIFNLEGTVNGPAQHMTAILGVCFLSNGLNSLFQGYAGVSRVFGFGFVAIVFSTLTVYENVYGSLIGEESFNKPPIQATALSLLLGTYAAWSIHTQRAKIKED
mmetsp:Transcript_20503/g.56588  ORF Transcript_20503/g.56588 Transcript_20503/m.56588 type:complete len:220 (+) Transcript_20503:47-706(+)